MYIMRNSIRKILTQCIFSGCILFTAQAQKPKVWIYSDMSDKTLPGNNNEGTINDPDDISAMAGYVLMCNEFNTVGIVVASTHRSQHASTPNQGAWAQQYFGSAFAADLKGLNQHIGGYPDTLYFTQSCIKATSEKFSNSNTYADISGYSTVKSLLDTVMNQTDTINVLCWGSLTEPAIFVKHCLTNNNTDALKKVRFIGHWTNSTLHQGTDAQPWKVANCNEDLNACNYLKDQALARKIDYYECGAIGQHGIVSGAYTGEAYFNQFKVSKVGTIFATGKYAYSKIDHSDAATYWVLLGNWGVDLDDINPNGTNPKATEQANENSFKNWSKRIHDELLRRAKAAVPTSSSFELNIPIKATIYPNPSSDKISIELNQFGNAALRMYNITGQTLRKARLTDVITELNISDLPRGVYFIEVQQHEQQQTVRFIKQ